MVVAAAGFGWVLAVDCWHVVICVLVCLDFVSLVSCCRIFGVVDTWFALIVLHGVVFVCLL